MSGISIDLNKMAAVITERDSLLKENSALKAMVEKFTPTNTGSTCASQIASEMELVIFASRNSGDITLAELLENWQQRLRTA